MPEVKLIMTAENSDHLRKIKEVQEAHRSLNKTVVDNQKREKGLIEDIEDALTELQEAKKKAYSIEDIAKYNQKIAEAKKDLKEYNEAGIKVEKTQQTMIQSIGKWVAGLGLLTTVLSSLKNAFKDHVAGLNLITQAQELWTQATYNLITANTSMSMSLTQSIAIAKQINQLRKNEREDLVETAKLQKQFNELYFAASDRRRTDRERIKLLDQAMIAHNLMIDTEIKNLNEQKAIVIQQLALRPKSNKLLDEQAKLEKALLLAESSRWSETKRIESLRTGLLEQMSEVEKKAIKETADKRNKSTEQYKKDLIEIANLSETVFDNSLKGWDALVKKEKTTGGFTDNLKKLFGISDEGLQVNEDILKQSQSQIDKIRDQEIDKTKKNEEKKLEAKRQAWDTVLAGEQAIFDILSYNADAQLNQELARLDKRTQAELLAAGKDEKKRQAILEKSEAEKLKIEKKYRKEQQNISIAQTVINGAQAIVKTFAEYGYTPPGWVAAGLMAALTALQVGVIKSQKFAKGGWTGKGGQVDETGQRMAGIVHEEEFVTRKGPAAKYRELLEAINRDDRSAMLKSFNKIDIPDIYVPAVNNSIRIDNNGPNSRLDRIAKEQKKLNEQISRQQYITHSAGKTIITKGNKTRIMI